MGWPGVGNYVVRRIFQMWKWDDDLEQYIERVKPCIPEPSLLLDHLVEAHRTPLVVGEVYHADFSAGLLLYLWGVGKSAIPPVAPHVLIRQALFMYLESWARFGGSIQATARCCRLVLGLTRMGKNASVLPYYVVRKLQNAYEIEESLLANTSIQAIAMSIYRNQKSLLLSGQGPTFDAILTDIYQLMTIAR
jgi:hypothetical protein